MMTDEVRIMNYWLGILGTWIFADGIASLYTYTSTDKAHNQSWWRDHSFRLVRCLAGIAVVGIGILI